MPTKSSFAQKLLHDIRKRKERLATSNNTKHSNSFLALESPKHDDHIKLSLGSHNTEICHTNHSPGKDNRLRDSGTGRQGKLLLTTDTISSKEMVVYHQKGQPAASTASGPWLPDATILAIQILTRRRNTHSDFSKNELLEINPINGRSHDSDLHADPSCGGQVLSSSFLEANETFRGSENTNWVLEPAGSSAVLCSEEGGSVGSDSRLLDGTRDLEESLQTLVHLLETSEQIVTPKKTESDGKQIRQPGSIEALVSRLLQKDGSLPLDRLTKHSHGDSRMLGAGNLGGPKLLSLPPPETKQLPHSPLQYGKNHDAFSPKQATVHQLPAPQGSSNSLSAASNGDSNYLTRADGYKIKPFNSRASQQEKARIPNVIAKLMGIEELPPNNISVAARIQKTRDAKGPISETKSSLHQRDENITKLNSILLNSQNALLKIDFQTRMRPLDGSEKVERKAQEAAPTAKPAHLMEETYSKGSSVQKKSNQTFKNNEQKNVQNIYRARGANTTVQMPSREIQKSKVGNSITTIELMQQYVQKPIPRLGVEGYLVQRSLKSDSQKDELDAVSVDVDLRTKTKGFSQGKIPTVKGPNNEVTHLRQYEKPFSQYAAEAKDAVQNAEGKSHGTTNQRKQESAKDGVSTRSTYTPKHLREMSWQNHYSHTAEVVHPPMQDQKNQKKAKFDGRHGNKSRSGERGKSQATAINKLNKSHKVVRRLEKQGIMHVAEPKASSTPATPFPYSVPEEEPAVPPTKMITVKEPHPNEAPRSKRTDESANFQKSKLCQEMPTEHSKTSLAQELKQRRKERMIEMANIRRRMEEANLEKHSRNFEVPSTLSGVIAPEEGISHDENQPESEIKFNSNINTEKEAADSSFPGLPTTGNVPETAQQGGSTTIREPPTRQNAYLPQNPEHQQGTNFEPVKRSALTEEENQLKQILVSNPALLDAAKALFDIRVPTGFISASYLRGTKNRGDQLVDCVQEIMRRKNRREELSLHHSNKFPKYSKILSLDDLVKGLNKDLNSLHVHGDHGCLKPADYLHKLMERDIQSSCPDTSCLWDMDWFEGIFAEERERIAREIEKHVLNGLLNEITEQLYS